MCSITLPFLFARLRLMLLFLSPRTLVFRADIPKYYTSSRFHLPAWPTQTVVVPASHSKLFRADLPLKPLLFRFASSAVGLSRTPKSTRAHCRHGD